MMRPFFCAIAALALAFSVNSGAEGLKMQDGKWRFEIQAGVAGQADSSFETDHVYTIAELEYEMPFADRWTFAFKLLPLFLMDQDAGDDDFDHTIFGGGAGVGVRVYQNKEARNGLFAELGLSALVHSDEFEDNGSSVNFLTQIGIGYKWRNDWHVSGKFQHISNAGLDKDNEGVNGWVLAIGTTF